ncbi:MAG: thymidylate synthase [Pseudomonadota bacterium]
MHYEDQYLDLMRTIWSDGVRRGDRTGTGTRAVFGANMRFSLADGAIPLLTTKRVYWKTAAREMLWFLSGDTNIRPLVEQKVHIWTDWPLAKYREAIGEDISRDDFEAKIIEDDAFAAKWGDLGPVYGKQWVDWPVYDAAPEVGEGLYRRRAKGINQIAELVTSLRDNPGSRRHIFEGWNVAELDQMALPPCHKTYQFFVADGRLICLLYQRSCDVALGVPFNIFSAALLTYMLAQQTDLAPGELIWSGGDVHLYENHESLVTEQLSRTPSGHPMLEIVRKPSDIFSYQIGDFVVHDYAPQAHIAAPVAV